MAVHARSRKGREIHRHHFDLVGELLDPMQMAVNQFDQCIDGHLVIVIDHDARSPHRSMDVADTFDACEAGKRVLEAVRAICPGEIQRCLHDAFLPHPIDEHDLSVSPRLGGRTPLASYRPNHRGPMRLKLRDGRFRCLLRVTWQPVTKGRSAGRLRR